MTNKMPKIIFLHDGQDDITWSEYEEVNGVKYLKASESTMLRLEANAVDKFIKQTEMEWPQMMFPWLASDAAEYTHKMRHQADEVEKCEK
jgi:hypothetical protein